MIKAALLDVDGTLFDTERLFMAGWKKAAKEYGVPLTDEMIIQFHGRGAKRNEQAWHEWFGEDSDYAYCRQLRLEYVEEQIALHGVPLKPGLFEFLDFLKRNDIKIVPATGTIRAEAYPRWKSAGILDYIDASVCGDEVERTKPDPDTFLKAAALVNADPKDCIVLEDSDNGLRAAHAAGCYTVMVPDLDPVTADLKNNICDAVCPSMFEVIELMKKNWGLE